MAEYEIKKNYIIAQLKSLCAHCSLNKSHVEHRCPVKELSLRVGSLSGVPLIVNSEFRGLLWSR